MPYCEFSAEWVEVADISELMYNYFASVNYGETDFCSSEFFYEQANQFSSEHGCTDNLPISILRKGSKHRRYNALTVIEDPSPSSTGHTEKLATAMKEVAIFPCSLLQEGSLVEVFRLDGHQRVWIAGILDRLDGGKALVVLPETNGNGKQNEWIEMDPQCSGTNSPDRCKGDGSSDQEACTPKIRPCMNVGNLPQQMAFCNCHRVGEILKIGDMVEAWTNDRWVEGIFKGLNENGLLVKLYGDSGSVTLVASSVRLAPLWINEQKSWQVTVVKIEVKNQELSKVADVKSANVKANSMNQIVSVPNFKEKYLKKIPEISGLPLITADQYASRSAMLSSLVVAWSPIVQLTSETRSLSTDSLSNRCSILAVGGKSGKISFWRILEQEYFSVLSIKDSTAAVLVGLLEAHSSWITTIDWALMNASDPQLILATGSSDGSVKIWLGYSRELLESSSVKHAPFSLLKEVIPVDSISVSVVSVIVPVWAPQKMQLAFGKGSGLFDVWICDISISSSKFYKVGSYGAHDSIITGLAWAFDGHCLLSCSQDDSVHYWILHDNFLSEAPIPSDTPGGKSSNDVPNVFDSCFGLAVSPGNLAVAMARSFDTDLLNPMYQQRSHKAAVEFFWIGGQQLDILSIRDPDFNVEAFSGFSEEKLFYWKHNVLWSLHQYKNVDKPLVVWDIIAALLAFKQSLPKYVEHVLAEWLVSCFGIQSGLPIAETLLQAPTLLSKISSRCLHLLNVICRHVVLAELKAENINCNQKDLEVLCGNEAGYLSLWLELLLCSERELRERLVAFSFSAILSPISHSSTTFGNICWRPVGVAQMEQWVALNNDHIGNLLKLLAAEVGKLKKSKHHTMSESVAEEQCSYCSSPVPYESPEVAFCQGVNCSGGGAGPSHKLFRCAASVQVCPTTPSWFCSSCQRWVSKLAPQALFKLPSYPSHLNFSTESSNLELLQKPLCPFCGILLQRLQPVFLLSLSPV
ncbi:uncharacterized protein LOC127811554 isoform X2 [Diospyros lotus]|nr:uncharacterized protein LOC127811554 isoform X2 [Diospyros lotus]XP_052207495.1 uncharacterized protein LOC127811554 isoform X2 [Diospyros lotus]